MTKKHTIYRRITGFSMIELMITIAIAAILLGLAAPNFSETIKNNRLITKTNDVVTAINIARQVAISRGVITFVCHSNNVDTNAPTCNGGSASDWNTGVIIYSAQARTIVNAQRNYSAANDTIIQQLDFNDDDDIVVTQANDNDYVSFNPNGLLFGTNAPLTFTICDDRTGESGREINVSLAGKISSAETTCT